ncbi:hypothetical protein L6452_10227 [Arctium lappa]|uniref:Uncharacterized protein n=1 Tax=Arctium lappa TaxID=4217 RepID=A0ACB9DM87_ARCLA|nr:hypothetical protein L6452_10227 [Arctium lappa]
MKHCIMPLQCKKTIIRCDYLALNEGSANDSRSKASGHELLCLYHFPLSHYDSSFEPTKTCLAFKDWDPIFISMKKAVSCLWSLGMPCGRSYVLRACYMERSLCLSNQSIGNPDDLINEDSILDTSSGILHLFGDSQEMECPSAFIRIYVGSDMYYSVMRHV